MVNPPRDEIRRIRAQLQEYGQVGDANVFYWFQNRKSRSKNKKNNQNSTTTKSSLLTHTTLSAPAFAKASTPLSHSSSSSSDKSSADRKAFSCNIFDGLNSPTCSVNQPYFRTSTEFLPEPYFFPASQSTLIGGTTNSGLTLTQGFGFPQLAASNDYVAHNNNNSVSQNLGQAFGNCSTSVLLTDLMNLGGMSNNNDYYKRVEDNDKTKMQQLLSYSVSPTCAQTILPPTTVSPSVMSAINRIQGISTLLVFFFPHLFYL